MTDGGERRCRSGNQVGGRKRGPGGVGRRQLKGRGQGEVRPWSNDERKQKERRSIKEKRKIARECEADFAFVHDSIVMKKREESKREQGGSIFFCYALAKL